jgi:hypothetical protein
MACIGGYLRNLRPIAAKAACAAGVLFSGDLMKTLFGRTVYVIKMIGDSVALLLLTRHCPAKIQCY